MTQAEVAQLAAAIRVLWPHSPALSAKDHQVLVRIGAQVLGDIAAAEALAFVKEQARAGREFAPTLGQVANAVLTAREQAAGTYPPDSDQAWMQVQRAVRRHGWASGPPSWAHQAIADAVEAIGWRELCMSERPDVTRAHFTRFYESARARYQERTRRTPEMWKVIEAAQSPPELPP